METERQEAASLERRVAPIEIEPEQWREMGHQLVDRIADWMREMPGGPVTPGESPREGRWSRKYFRYFSSIFTN